MNNTTLNIILLLFGFSIISEANAQIKKEFEIKVTDSGLYFNGEKRTSSDLNTNRAGFEYYFGRPKTPH